jgi:hypothetical protein
MDLERAKYLMFTGNKAGARAIYNRIVPENPKDGELLTGPADDVPLDWFEPDYFNTLPPRIRAMFDHVIALPEDETTFFSSPASPWKLMKTPEFMQHFGNKILAEYNLPSKEEVAMMKDPDESSDDETPVWTRRGDDDDDDDGEDGVDRQEVLEELTRRRPAHSSSLASQPRRTDKGKGVASGSDQGRRPNQSRSRGRDLARSALRFVSGGTLVLSETEGLASPSEAAMEGQQGGVVDEDVPMGSGQG